MSNKDKSQSARAGDGKTVALPEPAFTLRWDEHSGQYKVNKPGINYTECYTADQVRAMLAAAPAAAPAEAAMGDWQQYAKEGETAQDCIERNRRETESVLRLLAKARGEQERAYRCIQGMHNALTLGISFSAEGYHAPTIGAAKRFVWEGALDGSEYFIGRPVEVLHAALALPGLQAPATAAEGGAA